MSRKPWSKEQEEELISLYEEQDPKDVEALATHFGKNHRSIISKLVQLKIYIKPEVTQSKLPSVKQMVREMEEILETELEYNLNKKSNMHTLYLGVKRLNGDL
jgi:hypothetical protein